MSETKPSRTRARVAFFHVSAILGGAERSFLDLIPLPVEATSVNLPEEGPLAERVRATEWGKAVHFVPFAAPLLRLSRGDGLRNLWALPRALPAIWRYLREVQEVLDRELPDVVYSHGIKNHFLLTVACRKRGVPVIWHLQDFWPRNFLARAFGRWALSGPIHVICNSQAVRDDFDPRRAYTSRTVVVHNAIDAAAYPFRAKPYAALGAKRIVGFVGMLVPWKGPHLVIEAARILAGRTGAAGAPVEFWIVGGVPYRTSAASSRYAEGLRRQAPPNVRFLGLAADPRPLYAEIDVLCHASVEPEPFGRVLLEGMASGCIVAAADAGGPREMIEDGKNGFLFAPGDAAALADAIARALGLAPESAAELRASARARVEAEFSAAGYRRDVAICIDKFLSKVRAKEASQGW